METPSPTPKPQPQTTRNPWFSRRRLLLIGLPLLALIFAIAAFFHGGRYISTDDAYVRANVLTVSTDVSGTVTEVGVRENEVVAEGRLLYRLDDEAFRAGVSSAQAQLAMMRNAIHMLHANYAQKLAEAKQAEADTIYYQKEFNRVAPLVATNAATPSQVDAAQRALTSAQQRLAGLQQEAAATLADLGGRFDAPIDEDPRVRQAQSQCEIAQRNFSHTKVYAPAAGIISHSEKLLPGIYLSAGTPALALVETGIMWVEASPKETDLTHVHPGQRVVVDVDTYPDRTWNGKVDTVSPATGAQFALLPAQNASGNWVKVVQRIPVRISLAQEDADFPLRAGMSVTIRIDTGYKRTLADLFHDIGGWFGLGG